MQRNCGKGVTNPDFSDILKKYKKIPQDKGESIMRLKRLVSVAAAAVLALSVSLTAFAAPSTNISGVVTVDTKDNGVDGNGNTITASLAEVPAEYQSAVADVRKPETLKALLGSAYTDTMSVVDVKDVTVKLREIGNYRMVSLIVERVLSLVETKKEKNSITFPQKNQK